MISHRLLLCVILTASTPLAVLGQGAQQRAGEVTALLPQARIERVAAAPVEAHRGDAVFWRDWFETEVRARARLGLLDGSILNIGSGARLQVLEHNQATERTELELQFGKVRAVVKKLNRPGGRFSVRTGTAVIGVIGTHVYADSAPSVTTVINFEGRVRVGNVDRSVPGEEILEQFELAEVEPGRPPRKRLATLAELLRALEDTLPGPVTRLQPQRARAGTCVSATSNDSLGSPDPGGSMASSPFMQMTPRACAGPDITPLRVCVPATAPPGVYEYSVPAADGTQRWGAFLVEPPAPLQDAWLVYSPEVPPGATHTARLVGRNNEPLAGIPVLIRQSGTETVTETGEDGSFTFQAPESGTIELEVSREPAAGAAAVTATRGPFEAAQPIRVKIAVVKELKPDKKLPEFSQRGSLVHVRGKVQSARLGDTPAPVVRTVTRAGRTISSVAIPRDLPEGPNSLELEDAAGKRRSEPLLVYEVLGGRLDQRALQSGQVTQGEFLVCVGVSGERRQRVRARIGAIGPVRFRGKGGKGKKFEQTFTVERSGLLRIPFGIQAEKGAPGVGIPFTLTLRLSGG
ncbi:MAG: FecR domain-containing protein [Terriglobia bacterium]